MSDTTTTRGGARQRPVYEPKIVDEIPEDVTLPRSGPRPDPKFMEGLQFAMAHPGSQVELGLWMSENGAANQYKRINKGEIKLPVGEWEMETRRMYAEDGAVDTNGRPKRWSKLYARYEGPVSNDE